MNQMSEVLMIARLRVMTTDAVLNSYHAQVQQLEPNQRGLLGFSFWRSLEPDGGLMQVMRYKDRQVADDALEALVQSKVGPLVASVTLDPPDVALVTPKKKHGQRFEEVPVGSLCSLAIRFSDPGQQEELELDTDEVLAELAYIPGYLGSIWGNSISMNEEIISAVLWSSEEALMSSIPVSHKVMIQKWQKAI